MKLFLIFVIVIYYISHSKAINAVNVMNNALQLEDFSNELLLEIFDKFEFEHLVDLANTNHRFRELIIQHYIIPEYHLNERILYSGNLSGFTNYNLTYKFHDDGSVAIQKPELFLNVLRNFGHLILRLVFYPDVYKLEWRQRINSYINKYCSESLGELWIGSFDENMLLKWEKPFKNLSALKIYPENWDVESNNVNISEIFPSMRRLELNFEVSSSKCIDYHFPHLEHIKFQMYTRYNNMSIRNRMYDNIFDLNPQLRSINIRNMDSFDALRAANLKLNNLEKIEFSFDGSDLSAVSDNETIHFKSIKRLDIDSFPNHDQYLPKYIPLEFDQLEQLFIRFPGGVENKWFKFIKQQRKLKILSIVWRSNPINLQNWMSILESLPQLEVMKTLWNRGYDEVAGVMTARTNLKKITFLGLNRQDYNLFSNIIDAEWQIEGSIQDFMREATFIRRESKS